MFLVQITLERQIGWFVEMVFQFRAPLAAASTVVVERVPEKADVQARSGLLRGESLGEGVPEGVSIIFLHHGCDPAGLFCLVWKRLVGRSADVARHVGWVLHDRHVGVLQRHPTCHFPRLRYLRLLVLAFHYGRCRRVVVLTKLPDHDAA